VDVDVEVDVGVEVEVDVDVGVIGGLVESVGGLKDCRQILDESNLPR
jgi:hypothetical protein